MFQFPGFALLHLYIQWRVTGSLLQPSFLIRKSPDQRLFASFPELIAGYNVLLRFSMPRHPPYTLKSLTTFIDHRHAASLRPSEPKSCGPAGRAERVAARTGAATINNGSTIAKKVLDDVRPTERPKLGWGIHPCRGGHRGGLIFSDEPSVEPQDSFTCQRTPGS